MKAAFHTLGCKVNQYETQAMRSLLTAEGYDTGEFTPGDEAARSADILVINSCTVTGESDRKLRQLLRRCRRDNPSGVLVLTGCMPQAFPDTAAGFTEADIVLGNAARSALPRHIGAYLATGQRVVDIGEHSAGMEPLHIHDFAGRTRAFVKIEDGCNRFCSYCIIPYARGRVRSKPLDELRGELEGLAARGFQEVVLVGINLTAYGQEWGLTIADAVEAACGVKGISRVRLGSLEPDAMTPEVIRRLAAAPGLCPQFHLSLQSGCDATLRRMNRRYTTSEYAAVCAQLREAFPGCALTTDIMVGFPGEDADEFAASLRFVTDTAFARVHVFAYSKRPGTPAAKAPGQVSRADKALRSRLMMDACGRQREAHARAQIGRVAEVLLETRRDNGMMEGYTPDYLLVKTRTQHPAGSRVWVRITGHENGDCLGDVVDAEEAPR